LDPIIFGHVCHIIITSFHCGSEHTWLGVWLKPQETSSPPRSIPRPSTLTPRERSIPIRGLSLVGGRRLSKLRRRRASRAAAGVLAPAGVRDQDAPTWAGDGVILRNSAKLRFADGVWRPNPGKGPPPGVDIMDDGNGVAFGGGVDGASMRGFVEPAWAGEGDAARYINKLASSSPVGPSWPSAGKPP
jgi:hypothetical protein